ncbi:DNA-methyltransferase [Meiothermus rufus]|uniref:DNA-methyltransferase n=1 Tax=Meiothermus rufus TaxID=604332 RepID=UPI0024806FE1|nr:site-specific DNA-methyltransferase [Meiothermus rufus]
MFRLIYIDPPFNTGKMQRRDRFKAVASSEGTRKGFGGKTYQIRKIDSPEYFDKFDDFISFIEPRLWEAYRLLTEDGSFFLHLDYREIHYAKVVLDSIFGRECFMNEIIWAYDYGARSKKKWPAKHDNILWYVKDPEKYIFNFDEMDRIPYMAPGLVGAQKAELGKTPTDVWWMTIVPTNSKEKTGYPTQKPVKLLERIIRVHTNPGDWVLDFFAGSGTTGEAAAKLGRSFILVDNNLEAIEIMSKRLSFCEPEVLGIELNVQLVQPLLI